MAILFIDPWTLESEPSPSSRSFSALRANYLNLASALRLTGDREGAKEAVNKARDVIRVRDPVSGVTWGMDTAKWPKSDKWWRS